MAKGKDMGEAAECERCDGLAEGADVLSDEFFEARAHDLKKRLRHHRVKHVLGVSDTAAALAEAYGVDVRKARLAGLLHDWDKEYSDEEARARARALGVEIDPFVLDEMPRLLHGPTAAVALGRAWPELPADVLQSIARHTAAAVDMSELDMVVYVADAIEPQRNFAGLDDLRAAVGKEPLEELFMMTFNHILLTLVQRRRRLHPTTVEVWNYYVARSRMRRAGKEERERDD